MEHQSYKMMKDMVPCLQGAQVSRDKNYDTETGAHHGPEEHAVGTQRKLRDISRRKSILTVVSKVRGFVSWGK